MNNTFALVGSQIFDGASFHNDAALILVDGKVDSISRRDNLPDNIQVQQLDGGVLLPGFIDLQVNGGGGCQFNDDPSLAAIETICSAHETLGTTSLLPTLITDTAEKTAAAIDAAIEAQTRNVPGFMGLHLEGPHLSEVRKGAHDPQLIRKMTDTDLRILIGAASKLNNLMITIAPESVRTDQIAELSKAGAVVSLGHTNASFGMAMDAADSGASCVTHLFNAMSPLTHREPGLVGAALQSGKLYCGLIADGFHVDPAAIHIALAAKSGPGRVFLVSDAMAVTGSDLQSFELGGRKILRKEGRLTLENGTLAGADLDMGGAVRFMVQQVNVDLAEASKMASVYPAQCMKSAPGTGCLNPGSVADMVHLDSGLIIQRVWRSGHAVT